MRKLTISVLVLGLLMASLTGTADASGFIYEADNPDKQIPRFTGTENFVAVFYRLTYADLPWWAQSGYQADAAAAINNWTTATPSLGWVNVTNEVVALVTVKEIPSGPFICLYACIQYHTWFYETERNADYLVGATVWLQPGVPWGSGVKTGAIAHELGHVLGLDDRYPGGCNPGEVTIMDTIYFDLAAGQWFHCDGLQGPVALDDDRVTAYWSQGQMDQFTAAGSGSVGTYNWKDRAWAEESQDLKWYYLEGSTWVQYFSKNRRADVGVHLDTEVRTLTEVVDRSAYGVPSGRLHTMCGQPYFTQWSTYGAWKCSPVIWLD